MVRDLCCSCQHSPCIRWVQPPCGSSEIRAWERRLISMNMQVSLVHLQLSFQLQFLALSNQQAFAQASGRHVLPAACWKAVTLVSDHHTAAHIISSTSPPLSSSLHSGTHLTPMTGSPQKPKRGQWVTLMFILMHLSPHSWYKIRRSKAKKKKKRSGVLASEGHHIYIYSWWPTQVIARQSLEAENSLDASESWERSPRGSRGLSWCSDIKKNVGVIQAVFILSLL